MTANRADVGILSVDEVTARIDGLLRVDPVLASLRVRGEIVDFKRHTSGHVYFTIGGQRSRLAAVLFRSDAASVVTWPQKGDEVIVEGRVAVYPDRGLYQLYARRLHPLGKGAQARARAETERRLAEEGVFDNRLKRPFPLFPAKIVVVTSPTGAALQDVIKVASQRFPQCELVLSPCLVQGLEAPPSIVRAIARARSVAGAEAILLVRGGGSRDDLNPFDDERVVRAVRLASLPLMTGLGHEVDRTLADLAADGAAPTPSAAAERLLPDRYALLAQAGQMGARLQSSLARHLDRSRTAMEDLERRALMALRRQILQPLSERLEESAARLGRVFSVHLDRSRRDLASLAGRLQILSPLVPLSRGYAACTDDGGSPLRGAADLTEGMVLHLRFLDARAQARVESVQPLLSLNAKEE